MRSLALWRGAGLAVLLAVVALVPLAGNIQLTQVGVLVLMYVGAAVAWNIFSGFTGYISLGAAVFFGVGVYTVALITQHQGLVGGVVFALFPLGGLVAAVVAVPFGLVALRVRRHTFVVVTIAVFFIFQLMASNFSWTGGVAGIIPPFLNWNQATVYNPSTTPRCSSPSRRPCSPGPSGGRVSVSSSGRSGTTRTGPAGSGSRP